MAEKSLKSYRPLVFRFDFGRMSREACINIGAGTCAGVAQVVVGHPLDTIKVRMQTAGATLRVAGASPSLSTILQTTRQTLHREGVRGLYKGAASPAAGAMAQNAACFFSWGIAKQIVGAEGGVLEYRELVLAGLLAGGFCLVVETPVDLLKTQMQVQLGSGGRYSGVVDCGKGIYRRRGVRGLFQGLCANGLRFVPGRAVYLSSFEWAHRQASGIGTLPGAFVAGAFAGSVAWTSTYPFDVIRNNIMGDHEDSAKRRYRGVWHCGTSLVREGGWSSLWRGYGACMLRAAPVNGAVFTIYTIVFGELQRVVPR